MEVEKRRDKHNTSSEQKEKRDRQKERKAEGKTDRQKDIEVKKTERK